MNSNNQQTLTTSDNLTGAAGTDTLTATLNNGLTIRPTLSGIEKLDLTAVTNASVIDLASSTGVTTVSAVSSSAALTVSKIADVAVNLVAQGNSGAVEFGFTDASLAATAQTGTLTVDGQTGAITINDEGGTNKLETIAITSSNTASTVSLTTTAVGTTKITVAGAANLTLSGTQSAAVVTLDASAATGDVSATLAGATANVVMTGGSGNDTLTSTGVLDDSLSGGNGNDTLVIGASNWNSTDTISGGANDDTVQLYADGTSDTVADSAFTSVTSVETVAAQSAQTLNLTLGSLAKAAGVTTIALSSGSDSITGGSGYTGAITVTLGTSATDSDKVNFSASAATLTVSGVAASFTATDSITGGTGTADKISIKADDNTTGAVLGSSVTAVESVVLTADGIKTATVTLNDAQGVAAKTFTVDGSALVGGTAAFTLDDSAETDATATISVIGSAGADTITLGGGLAAVTGGDGSDTIRFLASGNLTYQDTIDGGAGTNTLNFMDGTNNTSNMTFTIVDADLAKVTNVQKISASQNAASTTAGETDDYGVLNLTLGANALAAGIVSVTGSSGADIVSVSSTYTGKVTFTPGSGNDTFTAGTGGSQVTFTSSGLTADDTITGGTGNDSVTITSSTTANYTVVLNATTLTGFENLTVSDSGTGSNYSITTNSATVASGATLTVNASGLLNNAGATSTGTATGPSEFTFDGALETNGKFNITGGAANDSLTGGSGADTISGGAGNDTITGGTGYDSLSGGDGNDTFVMATSAGFTDSVSVTDTVIGGAGTDTVSFTLSMTLIDSDLIAVSGVEVLDINGSADDITLTDAAFTSMGVTALTIDAAGTTGAAYIDVSALTSANSVTYIGSTTTNLSESVYGGAGNDTFRFASTSNLLKATDELDGGAGTDTIEINFAGATSGTVAVDAISGIESIKVRASATTAGDGGWINDATSATLTINVTNSDYDQSTLTVDASAIILATDGALANTDKLSFSATSDADETFNVTVGAGNDTISGGSGNDTLSGGDGEDSITGGSGVDNLSGGAGNDTFVFSALADFSNMTGVETVVGGAGTDQMTFNTVAWTLSSQDLSGINGIEKINLGYTGSSVTLADSIYTANGAGFTVVDSAPGAIYVNGAAVSSANSVSITFDGSNADTLVGGAGDDVFTQVDEGASTAIGSTTITGGLGNDTLKLNVQDATTTTHTLTNVTGIETLAINVGADADNGDGVTDILSIVTVNANVASAGTLTGNFSTYSYVSGSSTVSATFAGRIYFDGSAEVATTTTTVGKFNITSSSGADSLLGGSGADTLSGGSGNDTIKGGAGSDSLIGGSGDDTIEGGAGNDIISGGSGADTISGGSGADVMTGGADADVYIYSGSAFETGIVSGAVIYYGGTVDAGTTISVASMDRITDFRTGDFISTYGGAFGSGTNAVGAAWTEYQGLLTGTYNATANTFTFSTTGTDSLYVYDLDGLTTTGNDLYAIVLTGYVNENGATSSTAYSLTGLLGGA